MTYSQYKNRTRNDRPNKIHVVRHGRNGAPALVAYDSIPDEFQQKIITKVGGNPYDLIKEEEITDTVEKDFKAFAFFSTYKNFDESGLSPDNIKLWGNEASVLNTIAIRFQQHKDARSKHGRRPLYSEFYEKSVQFITNPILKQEFNHKLPEDPRRLRQKLEKYIETGYSGLVKNYKGNRNAKKVNSELERLILSMYVDPSKPYTITVSQRFEQFIKGYIVIYDPETGEIFNPDNFYKNGNPITISEDTVRRYTNLPKNRIIVDKYRNDSKYFKDKYEPHHHRHAPDYSFSKISLDDRDIPNSKIKAYYAYEILSGCVIGKAWSRDKDTKLFVDCVRDMFMFLNKNDFGVPLEAEVEHHLVNRFVDSFMGEGALFPLIRWCSPGNSQEKWAEKGNYLKKYGFEKNISGNIGRFYSKMEANRPKQVNEWNEKGMRIKEKKFTDEEAIENDQLSIDQYNNSPHPDFKGMTRIQVLFANPNPEMPPIDPVKIAYYFGENRSATIFRTQYIKAHNTRFFIPNPQIIEKLNHLKDGKGKLKSYTSLFAEEIVKSVYLFQGDNFICECFPNDTYNRAKSEWTEKDREAFQDQSKYVEKTRKYIKDGVQGISKVEFIENDLKPETEEIEIIQTIPEEIQEPESFDEDYYYDGKGIDDF